MEDQQENKAAEVPKMKVLSAREHEYVVNFRNRFLTFFALPLFLVFLALALLVSWLVHVPLQQDYAISMEVNSQNEVRFNLPPTTQQKLMEIAEAIESSKVVYALADGTSQEIDCKIAIDGTIDTFLTPQLLASGVPEEATLVIVSSEQRFLFKLLDELGKNIGVRKPPVE